MDQCPSKRDLRETLHFFHHEFIERNCLSYPEGGPSPDSASTGSLTLDFPAPRIMRRKFLLCIRCLIYDIFLQQPKYTKRQGHRNLCKGERQFSERNPQGFPPRKRWALGRQAKQASFHQGKEATFFFSVQADHLNLLGFGVFPVDLTWLLCVTDITELDSMIIQKACCEAR